MKLSDLSTDRSLDVLCEIAEPIANITSDKKIMDVIESTMDTQNMTQIAYLMAIVDRYSTIAPILLKEHRSDIYTVLSVVNDKSVDEIAAQNLLETMRQTREIFQDKELMDFLRSFAGRAKTA